jgi:hypothetical protein
MSGNSGLDKREIIYYSRAIIQNTQHIPSQNILLKKSTKNGLEERSSLRATWIEKRRNLGKY